MRVPVLTPTLIAVVVSIITAPPVPAWRESGNHVAHGPSERRKHLRAYIPISATLQSHRSLSPVDGLLQNLSEGGALVACHHEFSVEERIQVILHMPGGGDIRLQATVARSGHASDDTAFVALVFEPSVQQVSRVIDEYIRSEMANRHSRAVLVIDERAALLRQLSEQLVTRGYRPLLATTALQVTHLLEAEVTSVVLALIGSRLQSGSVRALLDWLWEAYPNLHRALLDGPINGTTLQNTLDRVPRERPQALPWTL